MIREAPLSPNQNTVKFSSCIEFLQVPPHSKDFSSVAGLIITRSSTDSSVTYKQDAWFFTPISEMHLPQILLGCWYVTYFMDSKGEKEKEVPCQEASAPPPPQSFSPLPQCEQCELVTISQVWVVRISFSNTILVLGKEYDAGCCDICL